MWKKTEILQICMAGRWDEFFITLTSLYMCCIQQSQLILTLVSTVRGTWQELYPAF